MSNFTCTMGRDELLPSSGVGTVLPTDFDKVVEAMRTSIENDYAVPVFSPEAWQLLGLAGGPVKLWLAQYIETSISSSRGYDNDPAWVKLFVSDYDYPEWKAQKYFDVFYSLSQQGAVPDSIYSPWTYEETTLKDSVGSLLKTVQGGIARTYIYALGGVIGAAWAYSKFTKRK